MRGGGKGGEGEGGEERVIVSEASLLVIQTALFIYNILYILHIYICVVRYALHYTCAALRANVAGRIRNRVSPAKISIFSLHRIRIESASHNALHSSSTCIIYNAAMLRTHAII